MAESEDVVAGLKGLAIGVLVVGAGVVAKGDVGVKDGVVVRPRVPNGVAAVEGVAEVPKVGAGVVMEAEIPKGVAGVAEDVLPNPGVGSGLAPNAGVEPKGAVVVAEVVYALPNPGVLPKRGGVVAAGALNVGAADPALNAAGAAPNVGAAVGVPPNAGAAIVPNAGPVEPEPNIGAPAAV